jgi:hypothetical protein
MEESKPTMTMLELVPNLKGKKSFTRSKNFFTPKIMQGTVRCDYSDEDTIEGTVALSVCLQVLFQSGSLNANWEFKN